MSDNVSDDREIGVEAARKRLGPLVDDAALQGAVTYLTRRGRRYAAIVPLDRVTETTGPAQDRSGRQADVVPAAERDELTETAEDQAAAWKRQAAGEERQFEARLKPVTEFGEGYQMAEWPGTGRYHLVHEGKRIGHAAKKPFTSRWQAHTAQGAPIPGSGTYSTRREALAQVALHHQHTRKTQRRGGRARPRLGP